MTAPIKCQLALQGGGAKLIALLAALEAVQELIEERKIDVTRIAGTSAGSIAAAILASGMNIKQTRETLTQRFASEILRKFQVPSKAQFAWTVLWRGRPLWEETLVAELLTGLFEKQGVYSLGDLTKRTKMQVHILASNLADGSKVVYANDPGKPIVSALLDSCGLPYCFRVWGRGQNPVIVDGGICENLPAAELLAHEATDGAVLAFSFSPTWPGAPATFLKFSTALLETAMNNSVDKAKARLGPQRVHEIRTGLSTLDFAGAADFQEDEAFRIRTQARDFFLAFVAREEHKETTQVTGDPWSELSVQSMGEAWRIYQSQHGSRSFIYERSSVIVTVNGLDTVEGREPEPDLVMYTMQFRTSEEFFCSLLSIIPTIGVQVSLERSDITVRGHDGRQVGYVLQPARDPGNLEKRSLLVHYTPPLPRDSGPYTLILKQRVPAFLSKKLRLEKRDDLFISTRPVERVVPVIDLVVHLPKQFAKATFLRWEHDTLGRLMTEAECAGFDASKPLGFQTIGWRGERVRAGTKFGAEVVL